MNKPKWFALFYDDDSGAKAEDVTELVAKSSVNAVIERLHPVMVTEATDAEDALSKARIGSGYIII